MRSPRFNRDVRKLFVCLSPFHGDDGLESRLFLQELRVGRRQNVDLEQIQVGISNNYMELPNKLCINTFNSPK